MPLFGRTTPRDQERAAAWGQWLRRRHPLAIVSLVLGVFSMVELGALVVPGIASIVIGILALRQIGKGDDSVRRGQRLAWAGIGLSALSLIIAAYLYLPHLRGRA